MSRFIAPLALVIALIGAAPASAGSALPKKYSGQTKSGSSTSSLSAGGSCTAKKGEHHHLVMSCRSSSGNADARWTFKLPHHAGSVTYQVSYAGSHPRVEVKPNRSGDSFRLEVKLDAPGSVDIASVTIEYYC